MHHLITDGWSFGVAAAELVTLYQADRQGSPRRARPPIQYADFAHWQRGSSSRSYGRPRSRTGGAGSRASRRWSCRPIGPVRRSAAPRRPSSPPTSPELSAAVRALGRREGVTPFMTLLAAFQLLLGRWSGQDDFAVGSPVANRTGPRPSG